MFKPPLLLICGFFCDRRDFLISFILAPPPHKIIIIINAIEQVNEGAIFASLCVSKWIEEDDLRPHQKWLVIVFKWDDDAR